MIDVHARANRNVRPFATARRRALGSRRICYGGPSRFAHPLSTATITLAIFACGCADLTKVASPTLTPTSQFDNPAGALLRYNGAIGAFSAAFTYQILATGLMTDELSFGALAVNYSDERKIEAGTEEESGGSYPYPDLSTARLEAIRAIASLRQYNPVPSSRIGELYALKGYTETLFAENLCSGVPLASFANDSPILGPTLSRSALLQAALADFDSAAKNVRDSSQNIDPNIASLVNIGKGRVLLDSGDFASAAAVEAAVSANYEYVLTVTTAQNLLTGYFQGSLVFVSDREGTNGLNFASASDPRLPVENTGTEGTGQAEILPVNDTTSTNGGFVLASTIEARLIQAEAALHAGNTSAWRDSLNSLRQNAINPAMSPLAPDSTDAADPADKLAIMFRERAFWLYLTGHRHGDMRRLIRQYGLPAESVFPTGSYLGFSGGSYGSEVTFVPFHESGNPNYRGCIDRNP